MSDDHDNDEIVKEPSDNVEDVCRQHIVEDSGDVNIHTNENQLSDDPDNDGEDDIRLIYGKFLVMVILMMILCSYIGNLRS